MTTILTDWMGVSAPERGMAGIRCKPRVAAGRMYGVATVGGPISVARQVGDFDDGRGRADC